MRAEHWLEELVQLYEYRVDDLYHGRSPRGDRQSFQALREALLFSDALGGPLRSRLLKAERQFRDLQRQGRVQFASAARSQPAGAPPVEAQPAGTQPLPSAEEQAAPQSTGVQDRAETMQHLAERLWKSDARRWMFARLWATRSEPRLMSLRLLWSAAEHLRRQQRGQEPVSLLTLGSAVAENLPGLSHIEALGDALLPLLSTAAGRQSLERALQDMEEQGPPHQQSVLHGSSPHSGELSDWAQEQPLLRRTVAAIRTVIGQWPATLPLGTEAEVLRHGHAYEAPLVTLNLSLAGQDTAPPPLHWQHLTLTLQSEALSPEAATASEAGTALHFRHPSGQTHHLQLRRDLPAELRLWSFHMAGQLIHAVLEGEVLMLRSERAAPQALQVLANRARLCAYLTQPHQAYAPMRLARAGALLLRGRSLDGTDLSAASAARYGAASPQQLAQLAVRGLDALITLSAALPEWRRTQKLQEAAQALGLDPAEGERLSELLGTAHLPDIIFDPQVLEAGGLPRQRTFTLLPWPSQPLTLDIDGHTVQLSELRRAAASHTSPAGGQGAGRATSAEQQPVAGDDFAEDRGLAVALAGQPPEAVDDILTMTLGRFGFAVVQHSGWAAYTSIF